MSANNLKEILTLYNSGYSGHAIARKYNLSIYVIYNMLKKGGVKYRTHSESMRLWWSASEYKDKKKLAIEMLDSGMRNKEIANRLNVSSPTITRWRKENGKHNG